MEVLETITDDELFCVVEDEESLDVEELFVVEDVGGTTLEELDLVLEVEVDGATLLLLESRDVRSYISSLLPAPQYS